MDATPIVWSLFRAVFLAMLLVSSNVNGDPTECPLSCPETDPDKLTVHLICHSHQDLGWVRTMDEYYVLQVREILNSVLKSLQLDPGRKFVYAEVAFLSRWYESLSGDKQEAFRRLIDTGQLELVGGGWSQNDEAVTHYTALIDQMALGLRWIKETFGRCARPRAGWQIDPFGHSSFQAAMMKQMQYESLFLGRVDFQDLATRLANKSMEFVWRGIHNPGLFTSILPNVYWPPAGFCFDILCINSEELTEANIARKGSQFKTVARMQAKKYRTNHVIMTMGMDFYYINAERWFRNLDFLINHLNSQAWSQIRVVYSTPACYAKAVQESNATWPVMEHDFLPYASEPHAYWTGFYTSRPSLKFLARRSNAFLQACKQLSALAHLEPDGFQDLQRALGVIQHHDAITGTEKDYVASDYIRMMSEGVEQCQAVVSDSYLKLVGRNSRMDELDFCLALNVSQCSVSEAGSPFRLLVYNPLAHEIGGYIRLPVSNVAMQCSDSQRRPVPVQITPIPEAVLQMPWRHSAAVHEVTIPIIVPPLGFEAYHFHIAPDWTPILDPEEEVLEHGVNDVTIENEFLQVVIDGRSGLMKALKRRGAPTVEVHQQWAWYEPQAGLGGEKASGAYAFNPRRDAARRADANATFRVSRGPLMAEVRQRFGPWLSQTLRLARGERHLEVEWTATPPIAHEVVVRYLAPGIVHRGVLHTDGNGRPVAPPRRRDERPTWELNITEPVAGNYYPVTSWAYIEDRNLQMAVVTDRAQGAASLEDGSIEFMVHRRLLADDGFGVDEVLNERGEDGNGLSVRGRHFLLLGPPSETTALRLALSQRVLHQPVLMLSRDGGEDSPYLPMTLSEGLPRNLHLLTLEPLNSTSLLVRVEHLFPPGTRLGERVSFSMQRLLPLFPIRSVTEMALSGDYSMSELSPAPREEWGPRDDIPVEPLSIRTFLVRHGS